jgi:hypothetical protein
MSESLQVTYACFVGLISPKFADFALYSRWTVVYEVQEEQGDTEALSNSSGYSNRCVSLICAGG